MSSIGFILDLSQIALSLKAADFRLVLQEKYSGSCGYSRKPQIFDFYPKSGPLEGGTNVTIEGIYLGHDVTGVGISNEVNGVTIGFVDCIPYDYVYEVIIKCQVQSQRNLGSISGPIIVKKLGDSAKSKQHYSFVNPKLFTITPSKGPTSGGTLLMIEGLHLDAGSHIDVFLGNIECNVTRRQSKFVDCITSARHMPGEEKLVVKFDNVLRSFDYYNFLYVEDPKILSINTGGNGGNRGEVRGIPSGGIGISVKGNNLHIVPKTMIYVVVNGKQYTSNCTIITAMDMNCLSPTVPIEKLNFPDDRDYVELNFGFIMDNARSVKDLGNRDQHPFSMFKMYRNPEYTPFTEKNGIKFYRSDYLIINGKNLDSASQVSDVTVWIGTSTCEITSLSKSQLTCRPAVNHIQASQWSSDIQEVIVGVGGQLNFTIGRLSYELIMKPEIFDFYPKSGPLEGGTNVTIEGIRLGYNFDDITGVSIINQINCVTIGFVDCIPYRDEYTTMKIKCQVQSFRMMTGHEAPLGSISGVIIVDVHKHYTAISKQHYSFVNPKILILNPSKGPKSGGTLLLIEGIHMDAGSNVKVLLGNLECNVTRRQSNFVECITSARHMPGEETVSVKFDNGLRFLDYYTFIYVEDPKILSMHSGVSSNRGEIRGIPSGGIGVTVKGKYFNIFQHILIDVITSIWELV